MEPRLVYITASDKDQAGRIGRELVSERLAACVNIIEGMSSIYRWQGRIQEDREVILIAKTTEPLIPALVARVKELHSYEVPCVVCLPILGGNQDFLDWIASETG